MTILNWTLQIKTVLVVVYINMSILIYSIDVRTMLDSCAPCREAPLCAASRTPSCSPQRDADTELSCRPPEAPRPASSWGRSGRGRQSCTACRCWSWWWLMRVFMILPVSILGPRHGDLVDVLWQLDLGVPVDIHQLVDAAQGGLALTGHQVSPDTLRHILFKLSK